MQSIDGEDEISSSNTLILNRKAKRLKGLKEDRISCLPDSVIVHILSFLPTTEDAIRTGWLSRRWNHLWTSLPNLLFEYQGFPDRPYRGSRRDYLYDFYASVTRALALHKAPKINSFSFTLTDWSGEDEVNIDAGTEKLQSLVSFWLRFAANRGVEELHLELPKDANVLIPYFLYSHSSFTKLFTCNCNYNKWYGRGRQVSWILLKELTISRAEFEDGALQMMLSACPLLEELVLRFCHIVTTIDASSNAKLKRVVLEQVLGIRERGSKQEFEISTPTVTTLQIYGVCYHQQVKFNLLNVSSLEDVTLDFFTPLYELNNCEEFLSECCHWVWQMLERVCHVQKLSVGFWLIKVLSAAIVKALCPPFSNSKRTCLTVNTGFWKWDCLAVASLLRSSPYLEKLVVSSDWGGLFLEHVNYHIAEDYWTSQAGSFYCLHQHLKTIQIVGLGLQSFDEDRLLQFIKFLLWNAKVLEKLVILAPQVSLWRTQSQRDIDNYYRMSQLLLSFPKSSPRAVVLFTR